MKRKLNLKERIQQFKAWRETPHPVAPNTEEEHECANCHDRYRGKFCPRCGQASRIGRYSFKTGILNFVDVWGLGNRSMFLTIRDLILRPGYMIRDFLKGMQMAYFPPFKMFFLLFALSVLVTHGLNIKGIDISNDAENEYVLQEMKEVNTAKETTAVDISDANKSNDSTAERVGTILRDFLYNIARFEKRFPSVFILMLLMLVSGVLYLFFRHSPSIPDLRYSEFFCLAGLYCQHVHCLFHRARLFLSHNTFLICHLAHSDSAQTANRLQLVAHYSKVIHCFPDYVYAACSTHSAVCFERRPVCGKLWINERSQLLSLKSIIPLSTLNSQLSTHHGYLQIPETNPQITWQGDPACTAAGAAGRGGPRRTGADR